MTLQRFTAENGTTGAALADNDTSGATIDLVAATGSITDSETQEMHGSKSLRVVTVAQTAIFGLNHTANDSAAASWYVRLDAAPTAEVRVLEVRHASGAAGRLSILADRTVRVYNAATASLFTTTTALTPGVWYRLDGRWTIGDGTGTIEFGLYEGDGTTALDTYSAVGTAQCGTAQIVGVRFGKITSGGDLSFYADDVAVDDGRTSLIGPAVVPPVAAYTRVTRIDASGSTGTVTLTQASGATTSVTITEPATGVFHISTPDETTRTFTLTATSGSTDTETTTTGGGTTVVQGGPLVLVGGTYA